MVELELQRCGQHIACNALPNVGRKGTTLACNRPADISAKINLAVSGSSKSDRVTDISFFVVGEEAVGTGGGEGMRLVSTFEIPKVRRN